MHIIYKHTRARTHMYGGIEMRLSRCVFLTIPQPISPFTDFVVAIAVAVTATDTVVVARQSSSRSSSLPPLSLSTLSHRYTIRNGNDKMPKNNERKRAKRPGKKNEGNRQWTKRSSRRGTMTVKQFLVYFK